MISPVHPSGSRALDPSPESRGVFFMSGPLKRRSERHSRKQTLFGSRWPLTLHSPSALNPRQRGHDHGGSKKNGGGHASLRCHNGAQSIFLFRKRLYEGLLNKKTIS